MGRASDHPAAAATMLKPGRLGRALWVKSGGKTATLHKVRPPRFGLLVRGLRYDLE